MKKWEKPILNDLAMKSTNESVEHYEVDPLVEPKSTWICSRGNTYNSREDLHAHIEEFWNDSSTGGTDHWEKQIS